VRALLQKPWLKAAFVALATASPAMAADMNVPPVPYKAPIPVSWTGFYIGGDIGARVAKVDASVTSAMFGATSLFSPGGCFTFGCFDGSSLQSLAARGGLYAGFNWQFAPRWVVGIEGDVGFADRKMSIDGWFYPGGSGDFAGTDPNTSFTVRTQWDASARARLGALIGPNTLIYVTGGASWLHVQATSTCPVTPPTGFLFLGNACDPNGPQAFAPAVLTQSTTRLGWTAGAGAESLLWGNWILRAEYRYADYGTWNSAVDTRANAFTTLTATYALKLRTQTSTIGIAYKF